MIVAAILVYLAALIGIGVWTARRNQKALDFFLAGRRLGLIAAVLATMASIMSGFVFVGGPGLFYTIGLGSFWIVISSSFTGAMMAWLLARPLHRHAADGCLTIPDLILSRYGCRFTSGCAGIAILLGVIGYLATQLLALGVILSAVLGVPGWVGLLGGVLVLAFYSSAGGMMAAVYTDVLQGSVMLLATLCISIAAIMAGGGVGRMSESLLAEAPAILSPWGLAGAGTCLGWFFLFAVGSLGQPHVVNKLMMVKDLKVLRHFPWILAVSMMVCSLVWLTVGTAVKSLVVRGDLTAPGQPDLTITAFLDVFTPSWLKALALAGVVSAIMSTADTFANIGAGVLTRDLPKTFNRTPKSELLKGRIFSVLLIGVALLLAVSTGDLVAYLGILGFGMFAAGLTPLLALGLNWPQAGAWSARAGVVAGVAGAVGLEALDRFGFYTLAVGPSSFALMLSLFAFVTVTLGSQLRRGYTHRHHEVSG
jgi:Na+/proline symporter